VIKLTRPDGKPLYLAAANIAAVTQEYEGYGGRTMILSSGGRHSVMESVDDVLALLFQGHGDLMHGPQQTLG
jgi:hypothetical protein